MAVYDYAAAVSGFVSGCCGVVVGHPFDTIKTRAQTGWAGGSAILRQTIREQGILGLYRGAMPPLLSAGWVTALTFSVYQTIRNHLSGRVYTHTDAFVAGMGGGLVTACITAAGLMVKVQLQNERGQKGTGTINFVRQLSAKYGFWPVVRRMYAISLPINILTDMFGRGTYFTVYDVLKVTLKDDEGKLSLYRRILAAGVSGVAGWTAIYPLDTMRSRRMASPIMGEKHTSLWSLARQIYKQDGARGFYRGYVITITRAAPVAGCILTVYDFAYEFLRKQHIFKGPVLPLSI